MNLLRYFFTLFVVLFSYSPLSAQETDEDDKFYLDFAGSAVFPYNPKGQLGHGVKAGAGFTAAFGYAFKEGFSTEIEWGHQKVGIGNPTGLGGTIGAVVSIGDGWTDSEVFLPPPITIEIDGEIKTQSLMGNFYYRYPKWKVSPYAGFGLGAFFHDGALTRTVTFESDAPPRRHSRHHHRSPQSPKSHSRIRGFPVRLSDHGRPLGSGLPAPGVPGWLPLSLK